jgi:chromosome segregation ATPase
MDVGLILGLIGGVGGPISGIIVAIIANHRNKKTAQADSQIADKGVRVTERDSHTREIAMIIDGFTESLASVREELKDTRSRYDGLTLRYSELAAKHEILAKKVETSEAQRAEMIAHIVELEAIVPNPPGPPTRPNWLQLA